MKNNLDEMEESWLHYPEATVIKMADRLHNLQTIQGFSCEKQKEYLHETKKLLIPLFQTIIERNHLGCLKQATEILFSKLGIEHKMIEERLLLTQ